MPSKHPRIALTVQPETRKVLEEYADACGKPLATIITELLTGIVPQIQELTKIMRAVSSGHVQAAREIAQRMTTDAVDEAAQAQQELEGLLPPSKPAKTRKRRAPAK